MGNTSVLSFGFWSTNEYWVADTKQNLDELQRYSRARQMYKIFGKALPKPTQEVSRREQINRLQAQIFGWLALARSINMSSDELRTSMSPDDLQKLVIGKTNIYIAGALVPDGLPLAWQEPIILALTDLEAGVPPLGMYDTSVRVLNRPEVHNALIQLIGAIKAQTDGGGEYLKALGEAIVAGANNPKEMAKLLNNLTSYWTTPAKILKDSSLPGRQQFIDTYGPVIAKGESGNQFADALYTHYSALKSEEQDALAALFADDGTMRTPVAHAIQTLKPSYAQKRREDSLTVAARDALLPEIKTLHAFTFLSDDEIKNEIPTDITNQVVEGAYVMDTNVSGELSALAPQQQAVVRNGFDVRADIVRDAWAKSDISPFGALFDTNVLFSSLVSQIADLHEADAVSQFRAALSAFPSDLYASMRARDTVNKPDAYQIQAEIHAKYVAATIRGKISSSFPMQEQRLLAFLNNGLLENNNHPPFPNLESLLKYLLIGDVPSDQQFDEASLRERVASMDTGVTGPLMDTLAKAIQQMLPLLDGIVARSEPLPAVNIAPGTTTTTHVALLRAMHDYNDKAPRSMRFTPASDFTLRPIEDQVNEFLTFVENRTGQWTRQTSPREGKVGVANTFNGMTFAEGKAPLIIGTSKSNTIWFDSAVAKSVAEKHAEIYLELHSDSPNKLWIRAVSDTTPITIFDHRGEKLRTQSGAVLGDGYTIQLGSDVVLSVKYDNYSYQFTLTPTKVGEAITADALDQLLAKLIPGYDTQKLPPEQVTAIRKAVYGLVPAGAAAESLDAALKQPAVQEFLTTLQTNINALTKAQLPNVQAIIGNVQTDYQTVLARLPIFIRVLGSVNIADVNNVTIALTSMNAAIQVAETNPQLSALAVASSDRNSFVEDQSVINLLRGIILNAFGTHAIIVSELSPDTYSSLVTSLGEYVWSLAVKTPSLDGFWDADRGAILIQKALDEKDNRTPVLPEFVELTNQAVGSDKVLYMEVYAEEILTNREILYFLDLARTRILAQQQKLEKYNADWRRLQLAAEQDPAIKIGKELEKLYPLESNALMMQSAGGSLQLDEANRAISYITGVPIEEVQKGNYPKGTKPDLTPEVIRSRLVAHGDYDHVLSETEIGRLMIAEDEKDHYDIMRTRTPRFAPVGGTLDQNPLVNLLFGLTGKRYRIPADNAALTEEDVVVAFERNYDFLVQDYALPTLISSSGKPDVYFNALMVVAQENGVEVKLVSDPSNPQPQARGLFHGTPTNKTIYIPTLDSNSNRELAHELVHALQFIKHPGMSRLMREFEAYLISDYPKNRVPKVGYLRKFLQIIADTVGPTYVAVGQPIPWEFQPVDVSNSAPEGSDISTPVALDQLLAKLIPGYDKLKKDQQTAVRKTIYGLVPGISFGENIDDALQQPAVQEFLTTLQTNIGALTKAQLPNVQEIIGNVQTDYQTVLARLPIYALVMSSANVTDVPKALIAAQKAIDEVEHSPHLSVGAQTAASASVFTDDMKFSVTENVMRASLGSQGYTGTAEDIALIHQQYGISDDELNTLITALWTYVWNRESREIQIRDQLNSILSDASPEFKALPEFERDDIIEALRISYPDNTTLAAVATDFSESGKRAKELHALVTLLAQKTSINDYVLTSIMLHTPQNPETWSTLYDTSIKVSALLEQVSESNRQDQSKQAYQVLLQAIKLIGNDQTVWSVMQREADRFINVIAILAAKRSGGITPKDAQALYTALRIPVAQKTKYDGLLNKSDLSVLGAPEADSKWAAFDALAVVYFRKVPEAPSEDPRVQEIRGLYGRFVRSLSTVQGVYVIKMSSEWAAVLSLLKGGSIVYVPNGALDTKFEPKAVVDAATFQSGIREAVDYMNFPSKEAYARAKITVWILDKMLSVEQYYASKNTLSVLQQKSGELGQIDQQISALLRTDLSSGTTQESLQQIYAALYALLPADSGFPADDTSEIDALISSINTFGQPKEVRQVVTHLATTFGIPDEQIKQVVDQVVANLKDSTAAGTVPAWKAIEDALNAKPKFAKDVLPLIKNQFAALQKAQADVSRIQALLTIYARTLISIPLGKIAEAPTVLSQEQKAIAALEESSSGWVSDATTIDEFLADNTRTGTTNEVRIQTGLKDTKILQPKDDKTPNAFGISLTNYTRIVSDIGQYLWKKGEDVRTKAILAMVEPYDAQRDASYISRIEQAAKTNGLQIKVVGYIAKGAQGYVYLVQLLNAKQVNIPEYVAAKADDLAQKLGVNDAPHEYELAGKLRQAEQTGEFDISDPSKLYTVDPYAVDAKNKVLFEELVLTQKWDDESQDAKISRAMQFGHRTYLVRQAGFYNQDKIGDYLADINNKLHFFDSSSYGTNPKLALDANSRFITRIVEALYPASGATVENIFSAQFTNDTNRLNVLLQSRLFVSLPKIIQYNILLLLGKISSNSGQNLNSAAAFKELLLDMLSVTANNHIDSKFIPAELHGEYQQQAIIHRFSRFDNENILGMAGITIEQGANAEDKLLISNIVQSPSLNLIYSWHDFNVGVPYEKYYAGIFINLTTQEKIDHIIGLDLSQFDLSPEDYAVMRVIQWHAQYVRYGFMMTGHPDVNNASAMNPSESAVAQQLRTYGVIKVLKKMGSRMELEAAQGHQQAVDKELLPSMRAFQDAFVQNIFGGDKRKLNKQDFPLTPEQVKKDIDSYVPNTANTVSTQLTALISDATPLKTDEQKAQIKAVVDATLAEMDAVTLPQDISALKPAISVIYGDGTSLVQLPDFLKRLPVFIRELVAATPKEMEKLLIGTNTAVTAMKNFPIGFNNPAGTTEDAFVKDVKNRTFVRDMLVDGHLYPANYSGIPITDAIIEQIHTDYGLTSTEFDGVVTAILHYLYTPTEEGGTESILGASLISQFGITADADKQAVQNSLRDGLTGVTLSGPLVTALSDPKSAPSQFTGTVIKELRADGATAPAISRILPTILWVYDHAAADKKPLVATTLIPKINEVDAANAIMWKTFVDGNATEQYFIDTGSVVVGTSFDTVLSSLLPDQAADAHSKVVNAYLRYARIKHGSRVTTELQSFLGYVTQPEHVPMPPTAPQVFKDMQKTVEESPSQTTAYEVQAINQLASLYRTDLTVKRTGGAEGKAPMVEVNGKELLPIAGHMYRYIYKLDDTHVLKFDMGGQNESELELEALNDNVRAVSPILGWGIASDGSVFLIEEYSDVVISQSDNTQLRGDIQGIIELWNSAYVNSSVAEQQAFLHEYGLQSADEINQLEQIVKVDEQIHLDDFAMASQNKPESGQIGRGRISHRLQLIDFGQNSVRSGYAPYLRSFTHLQEIVDKIVADRKSGSVGGEVSALATQAWDAKNEAWVDAAIEALSHEGFTDWNGLLVSYFRAYRGPKDEMLTPKQVEDAVNHYEPTFLISILLKADRNQEVVDPLFADLTRQIRLLLPFDKEPDVQLATMRMVLTILHGIKAGAFPAETLVRFIGEADANVSGAFRVFASSIKQPSVQNVFMQMSDVVDEASSFQDEITMQMAMLFEIVRSGDIAHLPKVATTLPSVLQKYQTRTAGVPIGDNAVGYGAAMTKIHTQFGPDTLRMRDASLEIMLVQTNEKKERLENIIDDMIRELGVQSNNPSQRKRYQQLFVNILSFMSRSDQRATNRLSAKIAHEVELLDHALNDTVESQKILAEIAVDAKPLLPTLFATPAGRSEVREAVIQQTVDTVLRRRLPLAASDDEATKKNPTYPRYTSALREWHNAALLYIEHQHGAPSEAIAVLHAFRDAAHANITNPRDRALRLIREAYTKRNSDPVISSALTPKEQDLLFGHYLYYLFNQQDRIAQFPTLDNVIGRDNLAFVGSVRRDDTTQANALAAKLKTSPLLLQLDKDLGPIVAELQAIKSADTTSIYANIKFGMEQHFSMTERYDLIVNLLDSDQAIFDTAIKWFTDKGFAHVKEDFGTWDGGGSSTTNASGHLAQNAAPAANDINAQIAKFVGDIQAAGYPANYPVVLNGVVQDKSVVLKIDVSRLQAQLEKISTAANQSFDITISLGNAEVLFGSIARSGGVTRINPYDRSGARTISNVRFVLRQHIQSLDLALRDKANVDLAVLNKVLYGFLSSQTGPTVTLTQDQVLQLIDAMRSEMNLQDVPGPVKFALGAVGINDKSMAAMTIEPKFSNGIWSVAIQLAKFSFTAEIHTSQTSDQGFEIAGLPGALTRFVTPAEMMRSINKRLARHGVSRPISKLDIQKDGSIVATFEGQQSQIPRAQGQVRTGFAISLGVAAAYILKIPVVLTAAHAVQSILIAAGHITIPIYSWFPDMQHQISALFQPVTLQYALSLVGISGARPAPSKVPDILSGPTHTMSMADKRQMLSLIPQGFLQAIVTQVLRKPGATFANFRATVDRYRFVTVMFDDHRPGFAALQQNVAKGKIDAAVLRQFRMILTERILNAFMAHTGNMMMTPKTPLYQYVFISMAQNRSTFLRSLREFIESNAAGEVIQQTLREYKLDGILPYRRTGDYLGFFVGGDPTQPLVLENVDGKLVQHTPSSPDISDTVNAAPLGVEIEQAISMDPITLRAWQDTDSLPIYIVNAPQGPGVVSVISDKKGGIPISVRPLAVQDIIGPDEPAPIVTVASLTGDEIATLSSLAPDTYITLTDLGAHLSRADLDRMARGETIYLHGALHSVVQMSQEMKEEGGVVHQVTAVDLSPFSLISKVLSNLPDAVNLQSGFQDVLSYWYKLVVAEFRSVGLHAGLFGGDGMQAIGKLDSLDQLVAYMDFEKLFEQALRDAKDGKISPNAAAAAAVILDPKNGIAGNILVKVGFVQTEGTLRILQGSTEFIFDENPDDILATRKKFQPVAGESYDSIVALNAAAAKDIQERFGNKFASRGLKIIQQGQNYFLVRQKEAQKITVSETPVVIPQRHASWWQRIMDQGRRVIGGVWNFIKTEALRFAVSSEKGRLVISVPGSSKLPKGFENLKTVENRIHQTAPASYRATIDAHWTEIMTAIFSEEKRYRNGDDRGLINAIKNALWKFTDSKDDTETVQFLANVVQDYRGQTVGSSQTQTKQSAPQAVKAQPQASTTLAKPIVTIRNIGRKYMPNKLAGKYHHDNQDAVPESVKWHGNLFQLAADGVTRDENGGISKESGVIASQAVRWLHNELLYLSDSTANIFAKIKRVLDDANANMLYRPAGALATVAFTYVDSSNGAVYGAQVGDATSYAISLDTNEIYLLTDTKVLKKGKPYDGQRVYSVLKDGQTLSSVQGDEVESAFGDNSVLTSIRKNTLPFGKYVIITGSDQVTKLLEPYLVKRSVPNSDLQRFEATGKLKDELYSFLRILPGAKKTILDILSEFQDATGSQDDLSVTADEVEIRMPSASSTLRYGFDVQMPQLQEAYPETVKWWKDRIAAVRNFVSHAWNTWGYSPRVVALGEDLDAARKTYAKKTIVDAMVGEVRIDGDMLYASGFRPTNGLYGTTDTPVLWMIKLTPSQQKLFSGLSQEERHTRVVQMIHNAT